MEKENSSVVSPYGKSAINQPGPPVFGMTPYWHLVGFAMVYGFILLFTVATAQWGYPLMGLFAGLSSTTVLVAIWSVFGPGSYLRRILFAHLVAAIPVTGLIVGALIQSFSGSGPDFEDLVFVILVILVSIVPISVGAQLPFWFFRSVFGWQLVLRDQKPEPAYNLRDIFVATFLFAFCFAAPQMVINLQAKMYEDEWAKYAVTTSAVSAANAASQPDGSVVHQKREIRQTEVERDRRERMNNMRAGSFWGYGAAVVLVFVGALISFPILLFVFWPAESLSGCGMTFGYVVAFWVFVTAINVIFSRGSPDFGGIFYSGLTFGMCAAGISIPLLVSRATGFRLSSPKRFAREEHASAAIPLTSADLVQSAEDYSAE